MVANKGEIGKSKQKTNNLPVEENQISSTYASNASASYVPHILFIVSQVYCGLIVIVLLIPLIHYLVSSTSANALNITDFLGSFQAWWKELNTLDTKQIIFISFFSFPIGFIFIETSYRFATKVKYIQDFNLERTGEEIIIDDDILHYQIRCGIQKHIYLQRVWDWENFQTNFCLYLEFLSFSFFFLFLLTFGYTLLFMSGELIVRNLASPCAILIFSFVIAYLFKLAREAKMKKFHSAHKTIELILRNNGEIFELSNETKEKYFIKDEEKIVKR